MTGLKTQFMLGDLEHFGDVLSRAALRWPDVVGQVDVATGRRLTWAEANERACRFGHALGSLGVTNGDRVAILAENIHQYSDVVFGAAKIGAPAVTINYRLAAPEVTNILGSTEPEVFVYSERFAPLVEEIRNHDAGVLPANLVRIGGDGVGVELEEMLAGQPTDEPAPKAPIAALDPLVILFSSGTTGVPKGVIWTHRGTMFNAFNLAYTYRIFEETRLMLSTPLSATCGMMLTGTLVGSPLVFIDFDADRVLDAVADTGANHLTLVPIMITRLCDAQEANPRDLSSLTDALYGGSPIAESLLERANELLACDFRQIYSMAEACLAGTVLRPEDHRGLDTDVGRRRLRSCGRPFPNVDVRVVDDDGIEVPTGEVGEIAIRSEGSMTGYWGAEDLTSSTLRDGWVITGDLGRFDEDGYLYIVDRKKDLIISGSFNVYPAEIERVLAAHPAVSEVAVVGVPDDEWGERVHAVVVARDGHDITVDELAEFARRQLSGAKRPRSVEIVDDLPRNALGKVVKRELRARYWAGRDRAV